ncbi:MAG: hypothetical protein AABW48_03570 [Nanoarchaeota archaeon]
MTNKTLTATVLSLALGLSNMGCNETNESPQVSPTKHLYGIIRSIDEDSFAIGYGRGAANFEFEHFRIEAADGEIFNLIFPGPSNYLAGDVVNFKYTAQSPVSSLDLLTRGGMSRTYPLQNFYFNTNGIILDHSFFNVPKK